MATERTPVSQAAAAESETTARLAGVGFMVAAWLVFAGIDTSAKLLIGVLPVIQVVFLRYGLALVYSIGLSAYQGVRHPLQSNALPLQLMRGIVLVASTAINFYCLQYLQLDQTAAIMFTVPLVTCALSVPLLGEHVGWRRWLAVCVGFLGVLIIIRPGLSGFHWAMVLALGNAVLASIYMMLTRKVTLVDSDETCVIYTNLIGALVTLPLAVAAWQAIEGIHILPALLIGLFGGIGHHFIVIAHRNAPAPVIAPFSYSHILWMVALGYLVFGHVPDAWTLVGASIVVGSGLFLIYRERQLRRAALPTAVQ